MLLTKSNKKTIQIVQGQRVSCSLYNKGHGVVACVNGEQTPNSVGSVRGLISYGGTANFDVAFPTGMWKDIPESVIRGLQWEIYDEVASPDEILDIVLEGNRHMAEAKRKADEAAKKHETERERLIAEYPHLKQGDGGKIGAANLRKELKAAFPGVKFSVTSDYNSIDIKWTDGPTVEQVRKVTGRYQEGNFNGMQDIYEYNPDAVFAKLFGGVRYVTEHRTTTPELEQRAWKASLGDSTGFHCGNEFVPADLPADWQTKYRSTSTLYHIRKAINEYSALTS